MLGAGGRVTADTSTRSEVLSKKLEGTFSASLPLLSPSRQKAATLTMN